MANSTPGRPAWRRCFSAWRGAPERFAPVLARALDDRAPYTRRAVGPDAKAMRIVRALMPAALFQRMVSKLLRIPRPGALRADPIRLRNIEPLADESGQAG